MMKMRKVGKSGGVRGYMVKSDLTPQDIINEVRGYLNGEHVRTQLK